MISCDGCQAKLDPNKPDTLWHGKLPMPSTPLTDEEKAQKKSREKYSIDHSVLCKDCKEKLGDFIQTLKPAGE